MEKRCIKLNGNVTVTIINSFYCYTTLTIIERQTNLHNPNKGESITYNAL